MPDPFGRAIRDFAHGEQDEPLWRFDGEDREDHPVREFYFTPYDGTHEPFRGFEGPMLDVGCGVGRHAVHFQERMEVVAAEVSDHLVETAREFGVRDARLVDMFDVREAFDRDRFRTLLANGTQVGLAASMLGLAELLGEFAHVTTTDARAVIDAYDPTRPRTPELLGYRACHEQGLGHRVFHFEYEGDVGPELLFMLFSPDRLREAAVGTGWTVTSVHYVDDAGPYYQATLEKR